MTVKTLTNVEKVRRAWGDAAPEWLIILAEACDGVGQTVIAKKLGTSSTVVSQAISNCYPSPLTTLEQRVRGELMREQVSCPVLGPITRRRCLDEQSRPYAATNALRVELRRTCPRCTNYMRRTA